MCFAPQRHALFRHRKFQKWSDTEVLWTFWLRNVLRVTTACTFSTSQLPKVVRGWCALYILTWKCASLEKHNVSRLSYLFAHLHLLSSDSFSSTLLSSNLSLLSASALLCFSSVHIVGSLTSKLPSISYSVHNTHFLDPSSSLPYLHHPPSFQLQLQAGDFQPFAPRAVQVCVDIEGLGAKAMHPAVQFPKSTWMGGTPSNNSISQKFCEILHKLIKNTMKMRIPTQERTWKHQV